MGNTKVRGDDFSKWIELVQKLHTQVTQFSFLWRPVFVSGPENCSHTILIQCIS